VAYFHFDPKRFTIFSLGNKRNFSKDKRVYFSCFQNHINKHFEYFSPVFQIVPLIVLINFTFSFVLLHFYSESRRVHNGGSVLQPNPRTGGGEINYKSFEISFKSNTKKLESILIRSMNFYQTLFLLLSSLIPIVATLPINTSMPSTINSDVRVLVKRQGLAGIAGKIAAAKVLLTYYRVPLQNVLQML
jgi:hypothetical protein